VIWSCESDSELISNRLRRNSGVESERIVTDIWRNSQKSRYSKKEATKTLRINELGISIESKS
jgi:hypothetical protein